MQINEKVVVITGASSGLGEATAKLLAEKGATVVLGARRLDKIDSLAQKITDSGGKALAIRTDVSVRQDVQALVDVAISSFGKIDVIVNNAGVMPVSLIEKLQVEEWEQMIDINIKGVLYGIAAALPYMQKVKSGHIINVASTAGHRVSPSTTVYSATKYAVRALSEGIRQELTPYNIRTTIISPGSVATELLDGITDKELQKTIKSKASPVALSPEAGAKMVLFAIEQPDEVDVNEILFRPTLQIP